MNIKKARQNNKTISILVVLVIFCIGAYWYAHNQSNMPWNQPNNKNKIDYSPTTNEQKQAGDQIKRQNVDSNENTESPIPSIKPSSSTEPTNAQKTPVSVVITSSDIQTGQRLTINAYINKAVGDGTCTLKLTKQGSQQVIQYAHVQAQASISACEGFTVDNIENGTWIAKVSFENDTYSGIATKEITLKSK